MSMASSLEPRLIPGEEALPVTNSTLASVVVTGNASTGGLDEIGVFEGSLTPDQIKKCNGRWRGKF